MHRSQRAAELVNPNVDGCYWTGIEAEQPWRLLLRKFIGYGSCTNSVETRNGFVRELRHPCHWLEKNYPHLLLRQIDPYVLGAAVYSGRFSAREGSDSVFVVEVGYVSRLQC